MKTYRYLIALLSCLALVLAGCGQKNPEAERAATQAAEAWLKHLDSRDYAKTWSEAAAVFRSSTTQQGWVQMVTPIHTPLGEVRSRELVRAKYTTSPPNTPEGEYVVLTYRTNYANKQGAIETITPMLDGDGEWRVSGYFIR